MGGGTLTPGSVVREDIAGHDILSGSGENSLLLEKIGNVRWRQIGLRIDGNEGEEKEAEDGGEEGSHLECVVVEK